MLGAMLTKFESKSNRVKGIAFHHRRPWILASLHTGSIQWWDYRMGTLLERFDEHEGPVRGICFHQSQPMFASGGDDNKIVVWSYKLRRKLFTLLGHMDYIRTVSFHHEEPWILSCSDDQTIRIWNWQSRNCLAIITGHSHYVMCAQFHHQEDLIVSGSLDTTVRVWDYSGLRKKHSARGLIAPSSSVPPGGRLMPFSTPSGSVFNATLGSTSGSSSNAFYDDGRLSAGDMFTNVDYVVKYILEGHEKGVNWVAFHPTQPMIVSASDDRQIKLWRMSENKAWELESFRGHHNNVNCAVFHPRSNLVISNSEDRSIRVWDISKRICVGTYRREHDRMWMVIAHPAINLFAAAHDSGMIVFKLERERPAHVMVSALPGSNKLASSNNASTLVYVSGTSLLAYSIPASGVATSEAATPRIIGQIKRASLVNTYPRSASYVPSDNLLLLTIPKAVESGTNGPNSTLHFYALEKNSDPAPLSADAGVFVARDRIAAISKARNNLILFDTNGNVLKNIQLGVPYSPSASGALPSPSSSDPSGSGREGPGEVVEIFAAGPGRCLLAFMNVVELWDVNAGTRTAYLRGVNAGKYVAWSADKKIVAFIAKHVITICKMPTLEQIAVVHETIRIKSAIFEGSVLLFTTLNHLKFALSNGDNGILCTLDHPLYLVHASNGVVTCLTRDHTVKTLHVDCTEYRFKHALVARDYEQVLNIIQSGGLIGQSVISYLQKKGYPEIALHFVQDPATRFDLAIECGQLSDALEAARQIEANERAASNDASADDASGFLQHGLARETYECLAEEAIKQGNVALAEHCLQHLRNLSELALVYMVTANSDKLAKLMALCKATGAVSERLTCAVYLGDVVERVNILREAGQHALAWLTCRTHGLTELASEIEAQSGVSQDALGRAEKYVASLSSSQPLCPLKYSGAEIPEVWPPRKGGAGAGVLALSPKSQTAVPEPLDLSVLAKELAAVGAAVSTNDDDRSVATPTANLKNLQKDDGISTSEEEGYGMTVSQ